MVRNLVVQIELAEPAVSKVQRDFLAQPTLMANAIAVTDQEHPDHPLNCGAQRIHMISSASYDDTGSLTGSHEGGRGWATIVPDTLGETLYDGACKRN